MGTDETGRLRPKQSSCFVLAFQPLGAEMAKKQQGYMVTVAGPGHNFERPIDEAIASQILALIMTGTATPAGGSGTGERGAGAGGGASTQTGASSQPLAKNGSLAAYIKAKKGEKNQITRFLATASWLSSRGDDPLTATAVSKALSDHHQKKLANSADCLNKNVSKGHCEKRKDGSFFITPEGLEALEGAAPE